MKLFKNLVMVAVRIPGLRNFNTIVTGKSIFYDQKLDTLGLP